MKRFATKASTILVAMLIACAACGMGLMAFAADSRAVTNSVDANGWNTAVTRGGELVDAGHSTAGGG